MVLNSKKRALFFSAGEQEMNMNTYEEYKTIIMAKFNTATTLRARHEAVCWDVYTLISMYEYITASVNWYRGYRYRLVTARLLVRFPHLLPRCSFTFPCTSLLIKASVKCECDLWP